MWCAQFKSADCTFELSQPSLFSVNTIRTCELHGTHMLDCILLTNYLKRNAYI